MHSYTFTGLCKWSFLFFTNLFRGALRNMTPSITRSEEEHHRSPVRVVEPDLFHEDADDELKDDPMESWELGGFIPTTQPQQVETQHGEWDAHENLVEVHPQNALHRGK